MSDIADDPGEAAKPNDRDGFSPDPDQWEEEERIFERPDQDAQDALRADDLAFAPDPDDEDFYDGDDFEEDEGYFDDSHGSYHDPYEEERFWDEEGQQRQGQPWDGEGDEGELEQEGQEEERQTDEAPAREGQTLAAEGLTSQRPAGDSRQPLSPRPRRERSPQELQIMELQGRERNVVHGLWDIARQDRELSDRLLQTLLQVASEKEGPAGKHALRVLGDLERSPERMRFAYHRNFPHTVGAVRQFVELFAGRGHPEVAPAEWAWEGERSAIGVEVKVALPYDLRDRGLSRCVDAIRRIGFSTRGVLLLTSKPPKRSVLPKARTEEFLGVLLWQEVEQRLREVVPLGHFASQQWSAIIDQAMELSAQAHHVDVTRHQVRA